MTNPGRIIGQIQTLRASGYPLGAGWIRDSVTGLYHRRTQSKNMIVLAGLTMMASSIQYGHANAGKTIRYLGVGTGYTTPAKGDTALGTEVDRQEIESWDNTNIAGDPVVMIASRLFTTAQAIGNLMECALFVNSTGAPMFSRGLFGSGYITDATQADPVVIESIAHGLSDGDMILIDGVAGMTELNGNSYYVKVLTVDTFSLYSNAALTASVNGTAFGVYADASPNTAIWKTVVPKTSAETLTVTYSLTFPVE